MACMTPAFVHIIHCWGNFSEFIVCLPIQGAASIGFLKYCLILAKQSMISKIINIINDDWELYNKTQKISEAMHISAVKGSQFTLYYIYFMTAAAILFSASSYIPIVLDIVNPLNESRLKTFPYEVDYVDSSNVYSYMRIHILWLIVAFILIVWIFTTDCFILMMVEHCSSLFHVVGVILEELETKNSRNTEKHEKNIISRAIVVHQHAIMLSELIESFVTVMYGAVFLIDMTIISIGGFHMILKWEDKNEVMKMAVFIITLSSVLFFNTIPSQRLINNSENVFYRIADCQWTDLTVKSQILIQMMLIRSIQVSTLTAGKVYPINMKNFSKIMKTSMSFFTVMKSMQ
ncbi:uncharacterized protein LOC122856958 [Aphidius gifuensis]|uniref:uncharacterized protein LOC122856958 n=1 Tax=Aphidius gifuensis TaxID=684658 RepID=UPI001CDCFE46|nr:uncharacterized protein LOC122856958 [Aphidius gifuensis]